VKTIHVIPGPGLKVRDPEQGDHIPADGRTVPDNSYWRRRLNDGDVTTKALKPAATSKE